MKNFITLILCCSCLKASADTWMQKSDFSGTARHAATGFFLNGKGYLGTGGTFSIRTKDFWEYDPLIDSWTQMADLPVAQGRSGAVAFAIGNYGYISTGFDNSYKNDLWQYDPIINAWTQKSNAGTTGRHYAVAFELNGYGYIGTGNKGPALKDFWKYDPVADSWTQQADFGGVSRSSASGFSINSKGYLGIGFGSSSALSDFWEYDPSLNSWSPKADFGAGKRSDAGAFAACDKGYIVAGVSNSSDKNELWEYDPVADTWSQKMSFGAGGREDPVAFSDGIIGYMGTGTNIFTEFNDFWQYTPDCTLLPIELTSFTAVQQGLKIEIRWSTESEFNNNFFTVEKSLDGIHFYVMTTVKGGGNSQTALNYVAEDNSPFTGINYYRLLQTDNNGRATYSNVIICTATGNNMMRILSVFPNPVVGEAAIELDLSEKDDVLVSLFDIKGTALFRQAFQVDEGVHQISIPLTGFHQGIYMLRINCEYGTYSQKLIKM